LGVTYDQLTNDILAAQAATNPEIQGLKAEIKALKEGVDKQLSEKDQQAEATVLKQMLHNVQRLTFQSDDFKAIRASKNQQDVVDLIHRTWKQTGEVMDEMEAAKLVEAELREEYTTLKKEMDGEPTPPQPQLRPNVQPARTLTNKDQATPPMSRRQRAIAAALGHLKR
jgi:hypothetical protein